MDVPVGIQMIVFIVFTVWCICSLIIGLGIVRLLEQIRDRIK